jgi:hypothetical protein
LNPADVAGFGAVAPNENDEPPVAPAGLLPNKEVLVVGWEPNDEKLLVAGAAAEVLPNPPNPLDVAGFPKADEVPNPPPVAGAVVAPNPNPLCG